MWWSAWHAHNPQAPLLALVIVTAMISACMLSGIFGVMVPLILKRVGADPATASSIFLTTGTDIASMGLMLALATALVRSEEHTSELQSLMRISYAVLCLKKKKHHKTNRKSNI